MRHAVIQEQTAVMRPLSADVNQTCILQPVTMARRHSAELIGIQARGSIFGDKLVLLTSALSHAPKPGHNEQGTMFEQDHPTSAQDFALDLERVRNLRE